MFGLIDAVPVLELVVRYVLTLGM